MARTNPVCDRTAWGYLVADPRFPLVWDANHGAVLDPAPELTAEDVRRDVLPFLRRHGAPHEHIELWALPPRSRLRDGLRTELGRPLPADAVMVFEGDPSQPPPGAGAVRVEDLTDPDGRTVTWLHRARNEFGPEPLPDRVVDQLVGRDLEVFRPLGLRWFLARVEGVPAGYSSLLSLDGVGYLDGVVTMPAFRRRGVASATVAAAVRWSLAHGDELVHLLAEPGGEPQRLYERLGFRTRAAVESFTRAPTP
jgi:GNAT superfamily N-acetyltransferase